MALRRRLGIVTGGSRGIGLASARELLRAEVVDELLLVSRDAQRGADAVAALRHEAAAAVVAKRYNNSTSASNSGTSTKVSSPPSPPPPLVEHVSCDFQDVAQVRALGARLEEIHGIAVLVNAAGVAGDSHVFARISESELHATLQINLTSTLMLTRCVVRAMLRSRVALPSADANANNDCAIVNVGSVVASHGNVGQSVYAASKAGLAGFTKSLAQELGRRNVRVNAVEPGFVRTDMTKALDENALAAGRTACSLRRFGEPHEIGSVIAFLASARASYVTGQVWRVDGGM